jgi:hypothetical protein
VCLVAEGGDSVCMLLHGDVVQQLRDIMVKLTASWSWSKYVPRCNRLHTYVVETCTPHSLPTWLPPLHLQRLMSLWHLAGPLVYLRSRSTGGQSS